MVQFLHYFNLLSSMSI